MKELENFIENERFFIHTRYGIKNRLKEILPLEDPKNIRELTQKLYGAESIEERQEIIKILLKNNPVRDTTNQTKKRGKNEKQ